MNNEELLRKMRKVKTNLENAKYYLGLADDILENSITFNNEGFKSQSINTASSKLNKQINNVRNKIIPKIDSM